MSARRKNGLVAPYSGPQITAWLALVLLFVEFPVVVSPILPIEASIPVSIVFGAMVAASFYYGYMTQLIDPMDVHLAKSLSGDETANVPEETMKQCWICDVQVAEHSMHCKFCNKCVCNFDHHCMWLNTCIGKQNYEFFFRTLIALFALNFSQLSIQAVLIVDSFTGGPTKDRQKDFFIPEEASNAIMIGFACFNAVTIFLIGQLLWFHIGLRQENLTTYQYIIQDHKNKREEQRRLDELQANRILLMNKAFEENKSCHAYRLRLGGICRDAGCDACDALELPAAAPEPNPENGFAGALGGKVVKDSGASTNKEELKDVEEAKE